MQQITPGRTHKEGWVGSAGFPKQKLEKSTKGHKRQKIASGLQADD